MELCAETEDFEKKFSAPALSLLNESEELFIGQFMKFEDGEMIVKFRATRAFPRKGEYVQCMYLPQKLQNYKEWESVSYEYLFKNRLKGTESVCIWQSKSKDDAFVLIGFRGVDVDFAQYIAQAPGAILVFGPNQPPIDYLANLYRIVDDSCNSEISDVLDYDYRSTDNPAILVKESNTSEFIYKKLRTFEVTILQGPPGTGKTQLIAELCARLCAEGKSVLVTALTNRALMEIATKKACKQLLSEGKVLKSNLTVDEEKELPQLKRAKQILPIAGTLMMGTYYIVSGFAADLAGDSVFDVVIMDEASQALLAMFAASKKIGNKNLWVGDTAQLGPVVSLNEDRIAANNYYDFVNGLTTITTKRLLPLYQLTRTYRLTQRSANYTGIFYGDTLISASSNMVSNIPSLKNILNPEGGPSLVLTDIEIGNATPQFAMDLATYIVYSLVKEMPKADIAVLTCLRKTTRALQKAVAVRLGLGNKIRIDTVARVQGLTKDITIFFIPNVSLIRSLEPHLFNVATSRAKEHTIIIADKSILQYSSMELNVRRYLSALSSEQCLYVPQSKLIDNQNLLEL
jgi:hypothetical protein